MAQSVIGALRVNLGLDSAKFTRGLSDAQKSLKQARAQFAAVAGVAAAMGAAISAAALAGARDIDKAAKAARRLDSSIGGFRALELAAGEAGVSLSGLANDVQTMNRELSSIGKSGNGKRALDALGLSIGQLQGLDADEKLAVIADQVKGLGLDAGQTTSVLRDLGIRNREMALLVLNGGEAIRAARGDIKEYGLELDGVKAAGIERANDQLGRLGLITQYAGQQLAVALVPAMGALAEAMTDSLREGGALRAVIDGLVGNLDRLSTYVGVAVAGFGVRYVAALGLATLSTATLSGALTFLRGALIRTGIGVLVVAAGELVFQFAKLVKGAGGFGNALGLLSDLALEVWDRIKIGLNALVYQMQAGWLRTKADALDAFTVMVEGAAGAVNKIVGAYVGAYKAILGVWDALPAAFSRLGGLAVNGLVDVLGRGVSGIMAPINAILEGVGLNAIAAPDFSEWKVEVGDAVDVAGRAKAAFGDAFSAEYVDASGITDAMRTRSAEMRQSADLAADVATVLKDSANRPLESLEALKDAMREASEEADNSTDATTDLNDELDDLGGSGGGKAGKAAKALDKVKTEAEAYSDALKKAAHNSEDLGTEKARIMIGGIDGVAGAFGDFIGRGLKDFKGFVQSIVSGFTGMISQMITLAARNKIMVGLGIAPAGLGGAAAASVPGGGGILGALLGGGGAGASGGAGAGGLLGGIGSALGTIGTNFGAGFMTSVYGGLGGLTGAVSGGLATGGLAGFATAAGAIAAPLLAVAAVFSFFKKKTKELDAGLRVTVDGMDALVESFRKVETKRFWGLSKKVSTSFAALDAETAGPLELMVEGIQTGAVAAAASIGIAAAAFDDFSASVTISTKGLSDADAQKAIEEALAGLGDDFAGMVPGLLDLQAAGEGSYAALQRLSAGLTSANAVLDTLGGSLYEISLSGAAAASALVHAFGGLDQFNSATAAYYQAFYSEQERLDTLTRQLTATLGDLGQTMPQTRAQFRALVEAQDLATESGRQMFAALVSLAGQFDSILPAIDSLANKLGALVADAIDAALGPIDAQISASNAAAAQARNSAAEFFRLADSLRTASAGIGSIQSASELGRAAGDFAALFAQAIGGDVAALGDLGGAGSALASDSAGFAATALELRRIEAGIAGQLNQAAAVSEALGLGADYQALLFDVQTAALEETRALLAQGDLTQEILERQTTLLENIGRKIVNSTDLQVAVGRDNTGKTLAGLVDNAGAVIGSLSAEGARSLAALQAQTASVVGSVDRNRDGVITAEEIAAARTLGGISAATIAQAQALAGQNGLFSNAITGQTAALGGAQGLTNQQLGKVRDLQGETVSITELVERAVAGSETLTSALLTRLSDGISVSGVPSMVAGLGAIGALIGRIVSAQEATLAAAEAEAARAEALSGAQRDLKATAEAQGSAISEVTAASAQIFKLAHEYRVFLNANAGAAYNANDAQFGVDDAGLFQAKYAQITGQTADARGFKNAFYSEGGVYSQTYGRAAELQSLAAQLQAQRQAVIDLGGIPQFARGGRHAGGLRIVGENGPELEYTGASQIFNARQTRDMLSGGGADPDAVHRMLLELVKNTKRTSDLLRAWDAVGQPETRGV